MFIVKYRERMQDGILYLRDLGEDGEAVDKPILKEWKSARALLQRFKAASSPLLDGTPAELGKVWIETLPGCYGTPWTLFEDDYAQAHIRTRICLVAAPDAYSCSGLDRILLSPGIVNIVEHRVLHSEINLSVYPRTHLIIDFKRPETDVESKD